MARVTGLVDLLPEQGAAFEVCRVERLSQEDWLLNREDWMKGREDWMKGRDIRDLVVGESRLVTFPVLALSGVVSRLDSCLTLVDDGVYRGSLVGGHFIATRDIECQGRDGGRLWRSNRYAKP